MLPFLLQAFILNEVLTEGGEVLILSQIQNFNQYFGLDILISEMRLSDKMEVFFCKEKK